MNKYSIVLGIATRNGLVFRHQYIVRADTRKLATEKALRKASWRFWGCGITFEDWSFVE